MASPSLETPPPRPPLRGGGCLVAAGLVIGPIAGLVAGQTSAGLLVGFALGILAAVAMAIRDDRR